MLTISPDHLIMVVLTTLCFAALLTLRGHAQGALLEPDEILQLKPSTDDSDSGEEIDDLMPLGGGDEIADNVKRQIKPAKDDTDLVALKDADDILHFKPPTDDLDSGVEIDDLMPFGGGDEIEDKVERQIKPATDDTNLGAAIDEPMPVDEPDEIPDDEIPDDDIPEMEKKAEDEKTLSELMPSMKFDTRYAPSDESYEHFAKKAAHEFTMDDVEQYEKRNAIRDKRWPRGIVPYQFSRAVEANSAEKDQIYAGMEEWMQKTCISFQPYSSRLARRLGHNQRILIRDDLRGCSSQIGKMGERWGTPQTVSLAKNRRGRGCMHARVVMHELGHALGFHHEQTRTDRDRFVRVNLRNVERKHLHNYEKVGRNYLAASTPYDYLSIMHYGPDSFGRIVNGRRLETMIPTNSCYKKEIGKARHLSYYDHKLMNTIYGCTRGCGNMRCRSNCYATKSGENRQCHCVCLDRSKDPCLGR